MGLLPILGWIRCLECKEKNWGSVSAYQIFPIGRAVVQRVRKHLTNVVFFKLRELR
jgi:hypothetical protein